MSDRNTFLAWFTDTGWLWALGGLTLVIAIVVALAFMLPMPIDDDEWGSGSF